MRPALPRRYRLKTGSKGVNTRQQATERRAALAQGMMGRGRGGRWMLREVVFTTRSLSTGESVTKKRARGFRVYVFRVSDFGSARKREREMDAHMQTHQCLAYR